MSSSPADAYRASELRALGHQWVDRLADHLAEMHAARSDRSPPVAPSPRSTPEWMAAWRQRLAAAAADPIALLDATLAGSTHLHDPGSVGHQVSVPLPLATLCEWTSSFLNNGMAVFEVGQVATAMEQAVVGWMIRHIGWPRGADGSGADGVFTSGGSLANLMALLAARHERGGFASWRDGAHAGPPLCALSSDQAHYCSGRAVQLMGWGAAGLLRVATDERYRLRPELLEESRAAAERAGRRLIAVVASACSTATGSYDPIEPIADFCERHGLWLHVDGAHGASALLSDKYRGLLRGIERADSVTWDAHKMLMMPALSTGILFRDGGVLRRLFQQEASYLFRDDADPNDLGARTFECTKRMMAMPLYVCLATYGEAMFAEHVTTCYDRARHFAAELAAAADFELATEPEANIVCFRHLPSQLRDADLGAQNRWQSELRGRILGRGSFYLVQTQLGDTVYLRTTIIHPLTSDDRLRALLDEIRTTALELR
jgi:L-2,4-diaminobutyrate decarboxylase